MAQHPKLIPYGMMNFVDVRENNCCYVGKTPLIRRYLHRISKNVLFFITFMPFREQRLEIIVNFVTNNINRKGD